MPLAVAVVGILLAALRLAEGQARLVEPPMRSSYWRESVPDAPMNIEDAELNCGGFSHQWQQSSGKCGACGDPFGQFPENQYPGKYSQFPPQRTYKTGTSFNATVYSRPNMLGWFEFRLCTRKDGPDVSDLQGCFDEHVLKIDETGMGRYYPGSKGGFVDMHVFLPAGVSCHHCLLQWRYNTGYRVDRNKSTCQQCLGCGPQEQYVNCADIRILTDPTTALTTPSSSSSDPPTTTTATPSLSLTTTTTAAPPSRATPVPAATTTTTTSTTSSTTTSAENRGGGELEECTPLSRLVKCEAKGIHRLVPGMQDWCLKNCLSGKCQYQFCACFCFYTQFKIMIDASVFNRVSDSPSLPMGNQSSTTQNKLCYAPQPAWSHTPGIHGWCQTYCPNKWCADMCQLSLC
ncbi:uncharacterized protein LOC143278047 [Babylonia areolata]|uniref:uncharacterized protein LOC143278047 n=1 Tax=Babylonia areolata TaxID=304850 RepID=UPI003FD1AA78